MKKEIIIFLNLNNNNNANKRRFEIALKRSSTSIFFCFFNAHLSEANKTKRKTKQTKSVPSSV